MTYIGNGPNFMVQAIAEKSGVKMPSFFGYMVYSFAILLPLFALMVWLFPDVDGSGCSSRRFTEPRIAPCNRQCGWGGLQRSKRH